jgi:hypothetical protein
VALCAKYVATNPLAVERLMAASDSTIRKPKSPAKWVGQVTVKAAPDETNTLVAAGDTAWKVGYAIRAIRC